jgi:hypothetical protein
MAEQGAGRSMTAAPVIITGAIHDALATLPSATFDAALMMPPVNPIKDRVKHARYGKARPLCMEAVDDITHHLIRITRGAIAMILLHGADEWAGSFTRHGRTVTRQSYAGDTLDVIVASTSPLKLPPADTVVVRPVIVALLDIISQPGDSVLDPWPVVPLVSQVIHGHGRGLTVIARTDPEARALHNAFTGWKKGVSLTPDERATALRRVAAGESQNAVARDLGIRQSNLNTLMRRMRNTITHEAA